MDTKIHLHECDHTRDILVWSFVEHCEGAQHNQLLCHCCIGHQIQAVEYEWLEHLCHQESCSTFPKSLFLSPGWMPIHQIQVAKEFLWNKELCRKYRKLFQCIHWQLALKYFAVQVVFILFCPVLTEICVSVLHFLFRQIWLKSAKCKLSAKLTDVTWQNIL